MRLRSQSDDRLVALARAGDEAAFEAIVVRYRRPLLRHAQRILPHAAAEDAVQQAFLSAWSALRRGDEVRELSAWLHRIQHNVALNGLRAQRGETAELTDAVAGGGTPQDELERRMAMRQTLARVAALPERQREAVVGVAVQGRSQEEVARTLGLSHGAVGALVMRGRRTLRAAANALTPPWVVDWFGRLSDAPVAKVAAVVAVAGAATGPVVVQQRQERPQVVAEATPEHAKPQRRDAAGGAPGPARTATPEIATAPRRADEGQRGDSSGPGSGRARSGGPGPGSSGSGESASSGPGSGELDSSGSASSGSGSGGSDDLESSGSGTRGSGSSGSGSGGSASSDSGSSGTGSGSSGSDDMASSGSGSGELDASGSGSGGSGSSGSELIQADDSSGSGSGGSELSAPDDSSGSGSSGSDDD